MKKIPMNVPAKIHSRILAKTGGLANIGTAFRDVLTVVKEYNITKLQVKVDIARIEAEREQAIATIQTHRDIMMLYFEHCFSERTLILEQSFQRLDTAIESGNLDALNGALTIIVKTIEASPLADFAAFSKAIADSDTTFTF